MHCPRPRTCSLQCPACMRSCHHAHLQEARRAPAGSAAAESFDRLVRCPFCQSWPSPSSRSYGLQMHPFALHCDFTRGLCQGGMRSPGCSQRPRLPPGPTASVPIQGVGPAATDSDTSRLRRAKQSATRCPCGSRARTPTPRVGSSQRPKQRPAAWASAGVSALLRTLEL